MARKLSILVFLIALCVFVLSPSGELQLDTLVPPGTIAGADANTTNTAAVSDAAVPLTRPTPTPAATPTPTPMPTPVPTPTPEPITRGETGDEVMALQQSLARLGFMEDEPDGIFGSGTVSAVNAAKTYLNDQYLKRNGGAASTTAATAGETGNAGTLPYAVDGQADWGLLEVLNSPDFPEEQGALVEGDVNSSVKRVQTRLGALNYLYKGADGAFGATTKSAISRFQQLNNLAQTGIIDQATFALLFSADAKENNRPYHQYKVTVDIGEQRVYVYEWVNESGSYSKRVRKMKCSTGLNSTPTPTGTFSETVRRGEEWHHFKDFGNCWARYAIHIDDTGNIMFHSVLYTRRGGSPTSTSVHALGRKASHGCIRLAVDDAKWLYDHLVDGTTVTIKK